MVKKEQNCFHVVIEFRPIVWKQNIYHIFLFQDGESRFLHKFESNQETEDPILQQFTQLDASIFNGKSAMIIVALTLENLENYQALWRNLIRLGRDHFGRHIYTVLRALYNPLLIKNRSLE